MKIKISNLIISIVLLTYSCENNTEEEYGELMNISKFLQQEVLYKKKLCDEIIGLHYYNPDSSFNNGEKIISDIYNNKITNNEYNKFVTHSLSLADFSNVQFYLNKEYSSNKKIKLLEIIKIRLLQNFYLNSAILENMRSHFQVSAIGVSIDNNFAIVNKHNKYLLHLSYFNPETIKQPVIVIDNDTIIGDGCVYEWTYVPKNKGVDTIRPKITLDRWGKIITFEPSFLMTVK